MVEYYISILKNPKFVDGIPQTGTALYELFKLVEAGLEFPEEEVSFIEGLYESGHYEQKCMADMLLVTIENRADYVL